MQLPDNEVVRAITRKWVLILLTLLVAVLIVVDIVLATDADPGNTWSELMREAAKKTPVVPWLAGLVVGHWFHPGDDLDPLIDPPGNALVLLLLTVAVLAGGGVVELPPWLPLLVAAPIGAFVWPVGTRRAAPEAIQKDAA
ncbi:MAG: hypothetical protein OEM97_04210 [Acidimicrobiia bacterium]|nr:hypothetical protein [Acidimicrobiia bacterium]